MSKGIEINQLMMNLKTTKKVRLKNQRKKVK